MSGLELDRKGILKFYFFNPTCLIRQMEMFRRNRPSEEAFIFVLGPPRSGTTLVHSVLLSHTKISGFVGETAVFSLQPIMSYERFGGLFPENIYRESIANANSLVEFMVQTHVNAFGKLPTFYCEKTPQHAKWLRTLISMFPNSKIIFCVRDPRDAYCSAMQSKVIRQARSLSKHASYFKACCAPLIKMRHRLDSRVLVIKYEEFVKSPKSELEKLLCFLNLGVDEVNAMLDPNQRQLDKRSKVKHFEKLGRPISSSSVERWRTELSPRSAATYTKMCLQELNYFGYEAQSAQSD